jgi:hypothetical protein
MLRNYLYRYQPNNLRNSDYVVNQRRTVHNDNVLCYTLICVSICSSIKIRWYRQSNTILVSSPPCDVYYQGTARISEK